MGRPVAFGPRIAIGLGGNLGDPVSWFHIAAHSFASYLEGLTAAPLYRTAAISAFPQPPFLNTVLIGTTLLPAVDLLAVAKALEYAAGRRRGPRHAPRQLDIDLLLYGDAVADEAELRLPHPALRERRFVLQPLADLEPDRPLPPLGLTARQLLASLSSNAGVERLGPWLEL